MTVYVGARDLNAFPVGTHQFIVITYPRQTSIMIGDSGYLTQELGPDINGLVIGAHNNTNLIVKIFEQADTEAAKEYFGGKNTHWYIDDWDTEMRRVSFKGSDFSLHAQREIIRLIDTYITNQQLDKINYPSNGMGFNSNSWVQTVIELAGGQIDGGSNMKGFDISHNKRIPKTYFDPYCPDEPRIQLNIK